MSGFVPARGAGGGLTAAIRIGLRDLRGGLSGFGVFLACIALGVAAIAGIGSFSRGLVDGLAMEGRTILGADASFQVLHQELSPDVRDFLSSRGRLSVMATTRAMSRTADGRTAMVELKAVDPTVHPLVGAIQAVPSGRSAELLSMRDGLAGALAEPALLARLDLKVGDRLIVGGTTVHLASTITSEPDRLSAGLGFGPRLIVPMATFRESGLIQPGSLIRWHYQILLPEGAEGEAQLRRLVAETRARFPEAGFEVRTRENAAPQLEQQVRRVSQFLTLVGLTALLVGGVGVANAVAAFTDRKRDDFATLKALGADGATVVAVALAQIGGLALVGVAIGLVAGVAIPYAAVAGLGAILPIPVAVGLYPSELLLAAAYGLLVALAFALWPLGRIHDVPVSALFRDTVEPGTKRPRWRYIAMTAGALAALAALSVAVAFNARLAIGFLAGAAGVFVLLRLVASCLLALARRVPRPRGTGLRLAIANIYRPGAPTPSVVLSLGLGLTLLVVIALVDASFQRQVSSALPDRAPSFFFVDIPNSQVQAFDRFVLERASGATLDRVPMLRGRFVAFAGRPIETIRADDSVRWILSGDRGITYSDTIPRNSTIAEGQWWPADYSGPPLVSADIRMKRGFGLEIGDEIVVNVLGRNITARIASFRSIQWDNLGINFLVVFSPNTFRSAPHTHLATLAYRESASLERETALLRDVAATYPAVTTVRVKDALEAIAQLAGNLATAIRGASLVTLVASVLVLAGAIASGHRARVYDATILKTLGASRATILGAYGLEYAILGLATAVFAVAAGSIAAYVVVVQVMTIPFAFSMEAALTVTMAATVLTVGFGLIGTIKALAEKPAGVLRHL